jgi:exodeoxyribonuclease V alpha subunit
MEQLSGTIERLTYYDEESHFAVASLLAEKATIRIVGCMPSIQVGETVRLTGKWSQHVKHGKQFDVSMFEFELPKEPRAIEKFLASGAIRGIGAKYAAKLVQQFGAHTLRVIDEEPERLEEIEGLGKKRTKSLIAQWKEHKAAEEIFIFLNGYGISRAYARRILRAYGSESLQKIRENPYRLAKEINGIGFLLADKIAKALNFQDDFPQRVQEGIRYALSVTEQDGHVCFPLEGLIVEAKKLLKIEDSLIRLHIGKLFQEGEIELTKRDEVWYVTSKPLFVSEEGICSEIKRLLLAKGSIRQVDVEKAIAWAEEKEHMQFAPQQKEAMQQALSEKFSIITGGPGTGKSTITRAICGILGKLTPKITLAAPTGRAAKRLSEITGRYASTLHRILKFDFSQGKFKHDRAHPLDLDFLVIDEASMIDTYLMYQILKAIPDHAKVLVIGDANQLPSIGPGNVLRDLISSKKVPVTCLSAIFRQAKGSQIIVNAHRVNEGQMPFTKTFPNSDFFFIEAKEAEDVRSTILSLVTTRLPQKYNFDPKRDIQVLVPMRKGPCGIDMLNQELQAKLTPEKNIGFFRVGDKVMQLRNNYSKDVYNGDIGIITNICQATETISIQMDEKQVEYGFSEQDELTLAYAVSVHKYQGSECPCVIMPVHTAHFKLLTRNLIYTGITRGKKLVILVGTKKALIIGVKNQEVDNRYTGLPFTINKYF